MAHPVRLASSAAGVILAGASFGLSHGHATPAACAGGQGSIAASPQAGWSPDSFATEFDAGANTTGAFDAWGARPVVLIIKGMKGSTSASGSGSGNGSASVPSPAAGPAVRGSASGTEGSTDGAASAMQGSATSGVASGSLATTGDAAAATSTTWAPRSAAASVNDSASASATVPGAQVAAQGDGLVAFSLAR